MWIWMWISFFKTKISFGGFGMDLGWISAGQVATFGKPSNIPAAPIKYTITLPSKCRTQDTPTRHHAQDTPTHTKSASKKHKSVHDMAREIADAECKAHLLMNETNAKECTARKQIKCRSAFDTALAVECMRVEQAAAQYLREYNVPTTPSKTSLVVGIGSSSDSPEESSEFESEEPELEEDMGSTRMWDSTRRAAMYDSSTDSAACWRSV
ncbi:uncharacterized protein F5147DRAFT_658898 [Suillus discolor]|uniref:Uncharacterized protein n=1 Tax=Suillus discolor TaxID=1912936 RepID=A0A9P7ETS8_9AGAM|nr:uncharacterized protein F5147DRAFT_658898 [Suillus discolor]KAG2087716.1 hypothetical protein F5147DRAFT_658898 [Suillus discolor]